MTFWVAGAVVGSSLIGANAAGGAADTQAAASNAATAQTKAQFDQNRADQLPWMNRGNAAGDRLQYLLGLPSGPAGSGGQTDVSLSGMDADTYAKENTYLGRVQADLQDLSNNRPSAARDALIAKDNAEIGRVNAELRAKPQLQQAQQTQQANDPAYGSLLRKFSQSDFQVDPGYQFRLSEGEKGINRSAASRGGLFSGATLKALSRFNQDTASNEYGNAYNRYNTDNSNIYNRLAGIAGTGQTATNTVGNQGIVASNLIGQSMQNAGEARASGYVGQSNAIGSGLSRLANGYQQGQYGNDSFNNRLNYSQQAGYAANTGYDPYQSSISGGFEPMGL